MALQSLFIRGWKQLSAYITRSGDLQQQVLLPVYTAFPFHSFTTQKLFKETLTAQS